MPKKRAKRGPLRRGPFTAADFDAALRLEGWEREKDTRHRNYFHPTRTGKVQVDEKWTGVKPGHFVFRGVMAQSGYSKEELLMLLNGRRLR